MITVRLETLFCRHNPIGVLFDMAEAESRLPWILTVHFQVSGLLGTQPEPTVTRRTQN